MYGKNVWVSDGVYERLERMKTTILRHRINDLDAGLVKVPSFNDVIDLALDLLEADYVEIEKDK